MKQFVLIAGKESQSHSTNFTNKSYIQDREGVIRTNELIQANLRFEDSMRDQRKSQSISSEVK